ncbi:hypothetical protein COU61_01365 [Candidatus Pacearchaeota archaeon CG10_big_fil_rev_8_21_14_0_10_35_13]|nr:MAG: hypothetical protein COU61_01365 [Candidatus Pacearchaeota archaeon CG10_big_fil_rev_8_21_14_0_10_35_13]
MNNKNTIITGIITIILLAIASAQNYGGGMNLAQGSSQIINWIEQIFGPFAYALFGSSEYLFEKVLVLVIIVSVIYKTLSSPIIKGKLPFTENKAILWIISIAVSALSTRFLTQAQWASFIILPYNTLGIVLSAAVPFIIMFLFVNSFDSSAIRKILWSIYAIIFIGIWMSRYDEVGNLSWVYFFTALLALILLASDGTIRRAMIKQRRKELENMSKDDYERTVRRQMTEAKEDLTNKIIDPVEYDKTMRNLNSQMRAIKKN